MFVFFDDNDNVVSIKSNFEIGGVELPDDTKLSNVKNRLDVNKQLSLFDIKMRSQAMITGLTNGYAPYEVESFVDQRSEWRNWHNDNDAATPIVDALATARGVDRKDLLNKIGNNVLYIVGLQGKQNAVEDSIKACSTEEELTLLMSELLQ